MLRWVPLLLLLGCTAHRSGDAIRSIRFEGNHGPPGVEGWFSPQTDRNLRTATSLPAPSRLGLLAPGFIEPAWLDPLSLARDALRVEVWYANHGYFDAKLVAWEVRARGLRPDGTPRRRANPVDIVGIVEQGEPSRVRQVSLTGLEGLPGRAEGALAQVLRRTLLLEVGGIWDRDAWIEAVAEAEATLHERSFAHARVESAIEVDPAALAVDVRLDVVPGPVCRFGEVRVEGLDKIRERSVRLEIPIEPGDRYSPAALARTRGRLFGLGTFATVDVLPDPEAMKAGATVIPVLVKVKEGKFREIQAGPVLAYEPGEQSLAVEGRYRDFNFLGPLWRFEQGFQAGAGGSFATPAELVAPGALSGIVPVGDLRGTLTIPHVGIPNLTFAQEGRVQLATQSELRYFRPGWAPSLSLAHAIFENATVTLRYRMEYTRFLGTEETQACDPETGEELTDNYLLSGLEQAVRYDGRNDKLLPTRGWLWSLDTAEFGGWLGGNRDLLRAVGEVRRYTSLNRVFGGDTVAVVAARLGAGVLVPYGDTVDAPVPVTETLKLGGGTTVRGFAADRLGPVGGAADCGFGAIRPELREDVPLGGRLAAWGNLELRLGYLYDVGVVGFVDAGRVWATPADALTQPVQVGVGGGLRYRTPIGPVRFDVAARLGNDEAFAAEPRVQAYLGLSEAF